MNELEKRIARQILGNERLRGVPVAVIEDVLNLGLTWLSEHSPMESKLCDVAETYWEQCEICGNLLDPENPEGAGQDAEGIWMCQACDVEQGCDAADVAPAGEP